MIFTRLHKWTQFRKIHKNRFCVCFCKLTLRLYTHQPKHEVKWGTLIVLVGNLWVLAFMWMPLDTIDWNTAADTSTSLYGSSPPSRTAHPGTLHKLLRIDQRKKTKSSRRRPGLQIPQILIWLSCAGKESDQWRPHHGSDSALTCRGSSCSVWHWDAGSGSSESCRSCGRAPMDLTCSGMSRECTMGKKGSEKFEGQVDTGSSLSRSPLCRWAQRGVLCIFNRVRVGGARQMASKWKPEPEVSQQNTAL